jgi:CheY-like chemotaxis protein
MTLRVLIADDNRDMANSLAVLLRREGFTVQAVYDGEQVLQAAPAFNPDAFILDIYMPVLDGLQTATRLRATPEFADKVFIALTAYSDQNLLDEASRAQFDEYLVKPFKWDTLLVILSEVASHSS